MATVRESTIACFNHQQASRLCHMSLSLLTAWTRPIKLLLPQEIRHLMTAKKSTACYLSAPDQTEFVLATRFCKRARLNSLDPSNYSGVTLRRWMLKNKILQVTKSAHHLTMDLTVLFRNGIFLPQLKLSSNILPIILEVSLSLEIQMTRD